MAASSKLITASRSRPRAPVAAHGVHHGVGRGARLDLDHQADRRPAASRAPRAASAPAGRDPANGKPESPWRAKVAPASASRISSMVRSATRPVRSVVRSSVSSWMTASCPSAVRWTSSSMASAPASTPSRNASIVFSGACAEAPRWATTIVMWRSLPAERWTARRCGDRPPRRPPGGGSGTPRSSQRPTSMSARRLRIATA